MSLPSSILHQKNKLKSWFSFSHLTMSRSRRLPKDVEPVHSIWSVWKTPAARQQDTFALVQYLNNKDFKVSLSRPSHWTEGCWSYPIEKNYKRKVHMLLYIKQRRTPAEISSWTQTTVLTLLWVTASGWHECRTLSAPLSYFLLHFIVNKSFLFCFFFRSFCHYFSEIFHLKTSSKREPQQVSVP